MNSAPVEQNRRIVKFTGYHSHLPALVGAFTRTEGPVLEIGSGVFSTPVLHDLAAKADRRLVTYEENGAWAKAISTKVAGPNHEFRVVESYDDMELIEPWGLALVDRPGVPGRLKDTRLLAPITDVVVLHAADDPEIIAELPKLFKWVLWHRHLGLWHTAICSNVHDLTKWDLPTWKMEELPPNPLAGYRPVGSAQVPMEEPMPEPRLPLEGGGFAHGKLNETFTEFAGDNFKNIEDKKQQRRIGQGTKQKTGLVLYTSKGHSVSLEDHYKGDQAFLVLSGPSSNALDLKGTLEGKRGVVTMCVNNSWSLLRPTLWTAVDDPNTFLDAGWKDPGITKFVPYGKEESRLGLKMPDGSFRWSGRKVGQMPNIWFYKRNDRFDPDTYLNEDTVNWGCHQNITDKLGCRGSRSVMMAAIRILYYLGFRTIYLVGADFQMNERMKYAFRQDRERGSIKGNNNTYRDLNIRYKHMRPMMEAAGLRVFNTNPKSRLEAFDMIDYKEAIAKTAGRFEGASLDTLGWYDSWKKSGKKVRPGVNPDGKYV